MIELNTVKKRLQLFGMLFGKRQRDCDIVPIFNGDDATIVLREPVPNALLMAKVYSYRFFNARDVLFDRQITHDFFCGCAVGPNEAAGPSLIPPKYRITMTITSPMFLCCSTFNMGFPAVPEGSPSSDMAALIGDCGCPS